MYMYMYMYMYLYLFFFTYNKNAPEQNVTHNQRENHLEKYHELSKSIQSCNARAFLLKHILGVFGFQYELECDCEE